tara:strand:- start:5057 stop:5938 length:882 start_codon:yes stop_codon:yes gene_type:complete
MSIQWLFSNNGTTYADATVSNVDTTITVQFGGGIKFPDPTADPNQKVKLTLEDRRTGLIEIVNMTSKNGDVLTVERAQENTTALSWPIGTHISCRMTAEVHNQVYGDITQNAADIVSANGLISSNTAAIAALTGNLATTDANVATNVSAINTNITNIAANTVAVAAAPLAALKLAYPVGSLYISSSDSDPTATLGFGTWTAYAPGRAIVGVGDNGTSNWPVSSSRGSETHTLTIGEMPAHDHGLDDRSRATGSNSQNRVGGAGNDTTTGSTGGGGAHNNIQPSIAVYIWRRVT